MKYRNIAGLIVTLFIISNLTGCIDVSTNKEVFEISFASAVSFDEIQKLDGKNVSIVGFMSTSSPLHGKYIYLQNMPYQSCPFCVPNTNTLANTLAVYAPKGKNFKFVDIPLRVTGVIKVEDVTDELGFHYTYRLINASVEKADITAMSKEIQIYTELVDRGFALTFTDTIGPLFKIINYEKFNITEADIDIIATEEIEEIRGMFNGLNPDEYKDIISVVDRLETLIKKINELIVLKDFTSLKSYSDEAQNIYKDFYSWLVKPSI